MQASLYIPSVGKVTILMLLRNLCVRPHSVLTVPRILIGSCRLRLQEYHDLPAAVTALS